MTGQAATQGGLRVVRGAVLAGSSTVLAVIAHVAGGDEPPNTALVLVAAVLLAAAGAGLARRRGSLRGILAVLGVTQVALHVVLGCTCGSAMLGAGAGADGMAGDGWGMLVAHAVAVLVTALLLARADAAVFAVAAALSRPVPRAPEFVPAAPPPAPVIGVEPIDGATRLLLRRMCPRRGPPADS